MTDLLGAKLLYSKFWPKLSEFILHLTIPVTWYCSNTRIPSHSFLSIAISWLLNEIQNAKFAIHLFAKNMLQSIHSLFNCWGWGIKCRVGDPDVQSRPWLFWLPRMRHEVPNWFRIYSFHILFSYILLSFFAFLSSFLPIADSIQKHNSYLLSI